ncbi:MAG: hypothetical protein OEV87_03315 [Phycisphaerae bacterium]|nr:hypothetical protein [Phycisphaerae bacterium]
MKKKYQRLWNIFLILLLLCAGVYILFLSDERDILKDKCHFLSLGKVGYGYTSTLERYKEQKGQYPDLLERLVPDYLPSLYYYGLGYFSDPYHWDAIKKYRKDKSEWPTNLEQLTPNYLSDLSHVNWEYSCDPNGLYYELSLSCDITSYEETLMFDSKGRTYLNKSSFKIR